MRRDHRPAWMRRLAFAHNRWRTRHFLAPQFESLGPDAHVTRPDAVEVFGAGITAGAYLHILSSPDNPVRLTSWPAPGTKAQLRLGDGVLLTGGVRILAAKSIAIGDGCMLAHAATVTDCDWHGLYDRVVAVDNAQPVTLAPNVWVGDGAFIGKGVSIGENAVIGARAVVTKDVPANVVVAGNPAVVVKALDPDAPRRTRMELRDNADAVNAFLEAAWLAENAGNSTLDWLRSQLWPKRGD